MRPRRELLIQEVPNSTGQPIRLIDFFLWGYHKNCAGITQPRNIQKLKRNIRNEIRSKEPGGLSLVMEIQWEKARNSESANEHHLYDIILLYLTNNISR